MRGQPATFQGLVSLFRDPVTAEKRRLLAERWDGLDPAVRLPGQGLGRKATGCGATIGIQPRCDFACTGCYLGTEANRVPALPTGEILAQLDELRAYLGPKSNVQITDGEVTLRPLPELLAILRHARSIGVVPMVMTHGDHLRLQPELLPRLMTEGGLTEISIHIDITQRGRAGYKAPRSEVELQPLREEMAELLRAAKRATGLALRAALTMTVTGQNLPQIADVVRWALENRDAFGLMSFQPVAQVGRTRRGLAGVTPEELWTEIAKATADHGLAIDSAPLHFGHPACTRLVPLLAIERDGRPLSLLQLIRDRPEDAAIVDGLFSRGLGGIAFRDDLPLELLARGAGLLAHAPQWFFGEVRRWTDRRLREGAGVSLLRLAAEALAGRATLSGFTLTSHHFMSPAEIATDLGRARLAACVFRLPDHGEMIPMCQMNAAGARERIYTDIKRRAESGATATEPASP